jgi:hypothetical protein
MELYLWFTKLKLLIFSAVCIKNIKILNVKKQFSFTNAHDCTYNKN